MKPTGQIVVVFGATGTAGRGAVKACLDDAAVQEVRAVTRRPLGIDHPKLSEVHCEDFLHLTAIEAELKGVDACLFCLGISARVVPEEEAYRRIHVAFALAAARALRKRSPDARFVYLSGQGAKPSSWMMWARVKAEAEAQLMELDPRTVSARPGYIHPIRPRGTQRWLLGPLLSLAPFLGIDALRLGRAMLALARDDEAGRAPVENGALRARGAVTIP